VKLEVRGATLATSFWTRTARTRCTSSSSASRGEPRRAEA